ncbi:MAG: hypothetical protein NT076_03355 [Candidatus Pacearchaeota archaeon]|nr:hypothetical protein [Candidatus Pacearchaeota archaeon]
MEFPSPERMKKEEGETGRDINKILYPLLIGISALILGVVCESCGESQVKREYEQKIKQIETRYQEKMKQQVIPSNNSLESKSSTH